MQQIFRLKALICQIVGMKTTFGGILRCIWLLLPIAWQSIWDSRVRKEMLSQLGNYARFLMR